MGRKLSGGRPFLKVVLNLCYGLLSVLCPQLLSQGTRLQLTPASVNCTVHSLSWWIKIREALSKSSLLQVLVMYSVRGTWKVTNRVLTLKQSKCLFRFWNAEVVWSFEWEKMLSIGSVFEHSVPRKWCCVGRSRRRGLAGGDVAVSVGMESL